MLKNTHQAYYSQVDRSLFPDVKEIMSVLKREVLAGCCVVLTGIIPTDEAPESNDLWQRVGF